MSKIYQVKISLKTNDPKAKSQTITGVVMANDQATAVAVAMKKTQKVLNEKQMPFIPKLVSASSLPSDFIYFEDAEELKTEVPLESEDHA